ncbi:hypothetical protein EXE43_17595 [Halorubrum sp. SS5]|nr:hypothetical protein EXE43_17595 [Halorubrum sp. SS5]
MSVYLISDTHFNDSEILGSSPRDFDNISDMNQTLLQNWNNTVSESDSVLFGGDLGHSDISKQEFWNWLYKVNSTELVLRGNHDPYTRSELDHTEFPISFKETFEFSHDSFDFCYSHKFSGIPDDFEGWHIHGHVHHKQPFLEIDTKRINVSADVLGYHPISLEELINAIEQGKDIDEYSPNSI